MEHVQEDDLVRIQELLRHTGKVLLRTWPNLSHDEKTKILQQS